jgi:hypothetical protein
MSSQRQNHLSLFEVRQDVETEMRLSANESVSLDTFTESCTGKHGHRTRSILEKLSVLFDYAAETHSGVITSFILTMLIVAGLRDSSRHRINDLSQKVLIRTISDYF